MTETNTSEFKCDDCDRTFAHKAALLSHQRTHARTITPDMPDPSPERPASGWVMENPVDDINPDSMTDQDPAISPNEAKVEPAPDLPIVHGTKEDHEALQEIFTDVTVKVKKLPNYGELPELLRATPGSAAVDLYAAIPDQRTIRISDRALIPTGIAIELPLGWVAKIVPRSGLADKNGITVLNTPGIIDADYRGEIGVILVNNTTSKFHVLPGMRIAQMLIERVPVVKFEYVDELSETSRGSGGFGSSGV